MTEFTPSETVDSESVPRALARTYGEDGWERVQEYRDVIAYAAEHPNKGYTAISTAVDLPPGRVRPWLDDAAPDPVNALDTANEKGWLVDDMTEDPFPALNILCAWIFAGGSISADLFAPQFSIDREHLQPLLETTLQAVGVRWRLVETGRGDSLELRLRENGVTLGRLLAALGAPVGSPDDPTLPPYLDDAPYVIRLDFARTLALNRAVTRPRRGNFPLQITIQKYPTYRKHVHELFAAVHPDPDDVRLHAPNIVLKPPAAALLYAAPVFGEWCTDAQRPPFI